MNVLRYSRKSEGPRIGHWGTPALSEYSCEDFPSRATRSCLLLRKDEIRAIIWPQIKLDLNLCEKTSLPNSVKSLGYIKCYSSNSHRNFKRRSNNTEVKFIIGSKQIQAVPSADILGITRDDKPNFNLHIDKTCLKSANLNSFVL